MYNWLFFLETPRYYVHTSNKPHKLSRRLKSPEFSVDEKSCLVFKFYISGIRKKDIKTISVVLKDNNVSIKSLYSTFDIGIIFLHSIIFLYSIFAIGITCIWNFTINK